MQGSRPAAVCFCVPTTCSSALWARGQGPASESGPPPCPGHGGPHPAKPLMPATDGECVPPQCTGWLSIPIGILTKGGPRELPCPSAPGGHKKTKSPDDPL